MAARLSADNGPEFIHYLSPFLKAIKTHVIGQPRHPQENDALRLRLKAKARVGPTPHPQVGIVPET